VKSQINDLCDGLDIFHKIQLPVL